MARRLQEPFVFAFREGLQQVAMDRRCVGQDYRLLLFLMGCLEWDNRLRFSQTQVARELGLSRQAVWASVQRLMQYGVLLPGPRLGSLPTYRLADDLAYYGELGRRRMARRQVTARQRLEALAEALHEGQALDITTIAR